MCIVIISGAAGFFAFVNRIITKSLTDSEKFNTLTFFMLSVTTVGFCFALHNVIKKTEFVQFYFTVCQESKKITLEPTEDIGLVSR